MSDLTFLRNKHGWMDGSWYKAIQVGLSSV